MEAVVEIQRLDEDFKPVGHRLQIAGPNAGEDGVWLATEVSGLLDPVSEAVSKPLGNRPGSRLVSTRLVERTLVFKVSIEGSGLEWSSRDHAWNSMWGYDFYTGVFVTTELSGCRMLKARLSEIEVVTETDPHVNQVTDVLMTVVADDPFWYSHNSIDSQWLVKQASGTSPVLEFDLRNLVYSGTRGFVYPVLEFNKASGTPVVTMTPGSGAPQSLNLPKVSSQSFTLNTDPVARQLQPDTVWREANGVRYSARLPKDFDTLKVGVSGLTGLGGLKGFVDLPFYRAWG